MNYPPYPKYKPSGIDWLGDIPEDWKVKKLKYVFSVFNGATPKSGKDEYWNGDIFWVTPEDLGKLKSLKISDTERKITQLGYESCGATIVSPGSIILSTRAPIGHLGVAVNNTCTNQGCRSLVFKSNKLYKQFFYYLLQSLKDELQSLGQGSTFLELSKIKLESVFLTTPEYKFQELIADFLDRETEKIDQIIDKNNRLVELLKEKRQAVITRAVTKGLNPRARLKPSGIDWLGDIPEDWEVKRLKYIGKAIIGLTYSPSEITDEKGTLVLRASNIRNNKIDLNDNVYVNKKILPKLVTKFGDILLCARSGSKGLIGKNAYIDKTCVGYTFGAFMTIYRSKHWRFLSYVFNSTIFSSQSELFITSTINQLTMDSLNNIIVALPNPKEQNKIVELLNKETSFYDEAVKKLLLKNEKLLEYKQALISSAVTGKIRVN